jgi:GntR family transcriptional regulator, transcriptional repressor for pyruvate dehydrogenase complex
VFSAIDKKESLSQKVVHEIEEAIRKRKISTNNRLPSEKELCLQFNVSRTVLREALKVLAGMGLINVQNGKGVFVNEISRQSVTNHIERYLLLKYEKENVLNMYDVRESIEPNILSIAAIKRTEEDIKELKMNVEKFCDHHIDFNERSILDGQFHLLITRATQNLYFPLIMEPIYNVMHEIRKVVYPAVSESEGSAEIWHRKILDAIINKDSKSAKYFIIRHLQISRNHTKKWLKSVLKTEKSIDLNDIN